MGKIDHDPVIDNFTIHDLPEVHVADFDALAGRGDAHELASVGGFLPTKGRCPLAHIKARFVDADLIGEGGLEGLLPALLKGPKPQFGAAAYIAHPAKGLGKKLANILDAMVV